MRWQADTSEASAAVCSSSKRARIAIHTRRAAAAFFLRQVRKKRSVLRSPRMKNTLLFLLLIALTLLSPSLSAAEWMDFPLAAGAREVYVSSSEGNDAND